MFFFLKIFDVLCMAAVWLTFCSTSIMGFLFLRLLFPRRKGLPPGPYGIPIFGYLPFLTKTPHKKLRDLAMKYGDIMSFEIFGKTFIHLNSYDVIREAFVVNGNAFAGRPGVAFDIGSPLNVMGLVPSEGDVWKIHRHFEHQTLRECRFGKLSLEGHVHQAVEDLVNTLESTKNKPVDVYSLIANPSVNVICSLLYDRKFDVNDPQLQKMMRAVKICFEDVPQSIFFMNAIPILRHFPLKWYPGLKEIIEELKDFEEIERQLIKEHQETFDSCFLRDYVDVFLNEMKKPENNLFTIDRLLAVMLELFFAGAKTVPTTIHWALRILMFRPEIQRKIQAEIDDAVGKERFPSVMDRQKMPYTEATISEVMRISSILPLSVFHSNPEEVKLKNFIIPKRSVIISNQWSVHYDPKCWPEPEKFDPTRFLSAEEKLEKRDNFLPFSVGKRSCLGESLARMEIFIFLASILQRFIIKPQAGDTRNTLEIQAATTLSLKPYKLCAYSRQ